MHSLILTLLPFNLFCLLFLAMFLIEWECFKIGEELGPLWKPAPQLPPWPRVWRVMFWLFPKIMTFLCPPLIASSDAPEDRYFRKEVDTYKQMGRKKSTEPNIEDALPF